MTLAQETTVFTNVVTGVIAVSNVQSACIGYRETTVLMYIYIVSLIYHITIEFSI